MSTDRAPERLALSARSVIATTLLGAGAGARLSVGALVEAAALFGISDSAVRTALSRMVGGGELVVMDSRYRLAGRLLEREQRLIESQTGDRRPWDGTWEISIVRDEPRGLAVRRALRSAAIALRLAELREGTWIRPANLDPKRLPEQRSTVAAQCARFAGAIAIDELPPQLFDTDAWSNQATLLLDRISTIFDPSVGQASADQLTAGFELSIAVVRHLQTDPLLPDELLPAAWPGPALRAGYLAHDARFKRAWANSIPHSELRS